MSEEQIGTAKQNDDINVFISWSGAPSQHVAAALRDWLPAHWPAIRPWLSSVDIGAGSSWRNEIQNALQHARIGVLCITRESSLSPWLNFEAGALTRSISNPIIPYLWGLQKTDLKGGPLSDFQAVTATRAGSAELVDAILRCLGSSRQVADFDTAWVDLQSKLKTIDDRRTFLERYVAEREPPLSQTGVTRVTSERAYNILLHMFCRESFARFRAFDLAFTRWYDLRDAVEPWEANIAVQIFRYLGDLFDDGRCHDFRRLLVIDPTRVDRDRAQRALHQIADHEESWRRRVGANVESRVFFSRPGDASRDRIAALCDFATFSGQSHLAIIETTLTSPVDEMVAFPKCDIVTTEAKVTELEHAFEEFWTPSVSIGEALMEIGPPLTPTLLAGANRLLDGMHTADRAVVIEGGYFDLRQPDAKDRLQHLDDALRLWTHFRRHHHRVRKDRLLLEAFLNDFTDERLCEVDACGVDLDTAKGKRYASEFVKDVFRAQYKMFGQEPPRLFGMKNTRTAVCDLIRRLLHSRHPNLIVDGENVYIDGTIEGRILLGYLRDGNRFVPRCTSLIAQHYYDLHLWVSERLGKVSRLWLFDFNLWTEKTSVKQGAAVAFALFDWPEDMTVDIINFIYESGARSPSLHDHSTWP